MVGGVFRNIAKLSPNEIADSGMKTATNGSQLQLQSDIVTVFASAESKVSMAVSYSTQTNVSIKCSINAIMMFIVPEEYHTGICQTERSIQGWSGKGGGG